MNASSYYRCAAAVLIALAFARSASAVEVKPVDEDPVKKGRKLFDQGKFKDSLAEFEKALVKNAGDRDTRFLCGLAAYWARLPKQALKYWDQVAEPAPRGTDAEWNIVRHRVMALSALKQFDAAELAIDRLREIRSGGKSPSATAALGFVREHFFLEDVRAGCWETFDERGEAPNAWTFTVARPGSGKGDPDKVVASLAVERAPLQGAGIGFAFSEEAREGPPEKQREMRRVYKHWATRPEYAEVRELALSVIVGTAKPLEETEIKKPPPSAAQTPDLEGVVPPEIKAMGLDPQAEAIVAAAWRLSAVKADVTRLARIAPDDAAGLQDFMREFNAQFPRAARDASDLTERVITAKAANVRLACEKISAWKERHAYLEFSLLTALNTRGRDIDPKLLETFAASSDFIVRQTANMMLARMGEKSALQHLFDEADKADARGCELLSVAYDELLGHQFDTPPAPVAENSAEKLKEWKRKLNEWLAANLEKLAYSPEAKEKPNMPYWVVK